MLAEMNVKVFNEIQSNVADAYITDAFISVSKASMTEVTEHLRKDNLQEEDYENSKANITVSCDGT